MKRMLQWLSRPGRAAAARSARPVRLGLEQLDERLVPSATSAMTTDHLIIIGTIGHYHFIDVQYHDLYAIDQSSGQVVDFHDNGSGSYTRTALGGPTKVQNVSASIDPNTGYAEVFAVSWSDYSLWRCDSYGTWTKLGGGTPTALYGFISATRDGQVFAVNDHDQHIDFFHANGSVTNLGNPEGLYRTINGSGNFDGIAASVDPYSGTDDVFAIGQYGALYVGSSNGGWQLIDNSRLYVGVAATPSGGVFANQNGIAIFHWTEGRFYIFNHWVTFWSDQQVTTAGPPQVDYWEMSADTDAQGHDEVYARVSVGYMQFNLYRFDQGSSQVMDYNVSDVAAAGGGYFFDVNPYPGLNEVWAYNPNSSSPWIYLGSGVQNTVW
jgi:hypothetical protein